MVAPVPALLLAGGSDDIAGVDDAQQLWKAGKTLGAAWTFAIQPGEPHPGSEEGLKKATELMVSWVAAVSRQRLVGDTGGLRPVTGNSGWMGNHVTLEIAPHSSLYAIEMATWLPDEVTARAWQVVSGKK